MRTTASATPMMVPATRESTLVAMPDVSGRLSQATVIGIQYWCGQLLVWPMALAMTIAAARRAPWRAKSSRRWAWALMRDRIDGRSSSRPRMSCRLRTSTGMSSAAI